MPLWGKSTTNNLKPKWLRAFDAHRSYAANNGWMFDHKSGFQEKLVAIGGLTTAIGNAAVSAVFFSNSALTQGSNGYVTVVYNQQVNVSGSPTISVTGNSANATATYNSGTGTNRLVFKFTVPSSTQTLSLQGQTINLASGTINDASANNGSNLVFTNTAVSYITGTNASQVNSAVTISVA